MITCVYNMGMAKLLFPATEPSRIAVMMEELFSAELEVGNRYFKAS